MNQIHRSASAGLYAVYLCVAFFVSSCFDGSAEEFTATLGSGEKVRVIALDSKLSHSGKPALCVEIMAPNETYSQPDYSSFSELARSRDLFEGWLYVEIRAYPQVERKTLFDVSAAANAHGEIDLRFVESPCPE